MARKIISGQLGWIFFKMALWRCNSYSTQCTYLKLTVQCFQYNHRCMQPSSQFWNIFITSKGNAVPFSRHPPNPPTAPNPKPPLGYFLSLFRIFIRVKSYHLRLWGSLGTLGISLNIFFCSSLYPSSFPSPLALGLHVGRSA